MKIPLKELYNNRHFIKEHFEIKSELDRFKNSFDIFKYFLIYDDVAKLKHICPDMSLTRENLSEFFIWLIDIQIEKNKVVDEKLLKLRESFRCNEIPDVLIHNDVTVIVNYSNFNLKEYDSRTLMVILNNISGEYYSKAVKKLYEVLSEKNKMVPAPKDDTVLVTDDNFYMVLNDNGIPKYITIYDDKTWDFIDRENITSNNYKVYNLFDFWRTGKPPELKTGNILLIRTSDKEYESIVPVGDLFNLEELLRRYNQYGELKWNLQELSFDDWNTNFHTIPDPVPDTVLIIKKDGEYNIFTVIYDEIESDYYYRNNCSDLTIKYKLSNIEKEFGDFYYWRIQELDIPTEFKHKRKPLPIPEPKLGYELSIRINNIIEHVFNVDDIDDKLYYVSNNTLYSKDDIEYKLDGTYYIWEYKKIKWR